ncbi:MAG: addiction module protein [Propionibacteriaceae bacterium]|jgi:hypothetical protein|nr:addiction module protein [Propionibacteriaceae bacterium]
MTIAEAITAEETRAEIEAAWRDELRNRISDVENGRVELADHETTVAMARELLAGRKK